VDGTLLVLHKVVTCDPQVGNGVQFTKMLPEDIEELRAFLGRRRPGERLGQEVSLEIGTA
jgi:hypothetical protein